MRSSHLRFALAVLIAANPLAAFGQRLSLGVIGGGSPTDAFLTQTEPPPPPPFTPTRVFSPSKDYIVGGMLEFHFNPRWSLEADGMFRKLHMAWAEVEPDGTLNSVSASPVITWEFPVLVKYHFGESKLRPFIEAGPSFRTAGNLNGTNPSHEGITGGLGVEMHAGSFNIAPVVRYTRWASDTYMYSSIWNTNRNQVEVLVGFSRGGGLESNPLGGRVSLGTIVGTNLTGGIRTSSQTVFNVINGVPESSTGVVSSGPKSFIVGPTVAVDVTRDFSIEADALYRPVGERVTDMRNGMTSGGTYRYVTWEFPVLARYRFSIGRVHPFVALGPSFRAPQTLDGASTHGLSAGAGIEAHWRFLKITPTLRYTHWARDTGPVPSGVVQNQLDLLTAFSF